MLRLKGERDDEIIETVDPDEISAEDAFGEDFESGGWGGDDESVEGERRGGRLWRGPGLAVAAFVPTFLALFLGLPHLFGSPPRPRPAPPAPVAAPAPEATARPEATMRPETATDSGDRAAAPRAEAPAAPDTDTSALSLPPAAPPLPKVPPRRAAEARHAPSDTRESGGEWSPAAAFADRGAADRLVSSIRARGQRAEIRADGAPSEPWVVWVRWEPSSRRR